MRRPSPGLLPRLAALALAVLAAVAVAAALRSGGDGAEVPKAEVPAPPAVREDDDVEPFEDPFTYDPGERRAFETRAAAGSSHPIYVFSPGGAQASAARTARWRDLVERAAEEADVSADRLEGLVLLESAGRPDAIAGGDVDGAVGLTQILAETGQNLLGLRVDVEQSKRLTRRITRERRRGRETKARRLERRRARVDERFDPRRALAATARYLILAKRRFGREDLAFVSYHMGIGNLEGVLRAYAGARDDDRPIREIVGEAKLTYAQVYFDSGPRRHRGAYARLSRLGDDSSNYYWKVLGAREILRLHREEPDQLARRSALHTAKNSAEEVLHPESTSERFDTPKDLERAWEAERIVPFPDQPARLALIRSRTMGELARRVRREPSLYRGLRPEALALAIYIGAQVRELSGDDTPLVVTSTVRDGAYQRELIRGNGEATRNYSLHTTGYALDVRRRYGSRRQALAFQYVLDRLRALDVIAWVREPGAIHITVSRDAQPLLPLLDRIEPGA
ncbi:MAG: hypothetical protein AVDCRST_MAG30-2929 [uncultured Solirubrobacteraceae bacterium]|uniref:Transglycosylase SLT domain-containing protein n=1 Tax=uncultured Solirubrobacteraceae bacterium TaxID=1162706 RepID=A0A6J4TBG6_9ACTN|nr:MAG: hypothetical protein AVDCRST_MAG30-2929 [uncultured Solirubrobacteraceae bacterium]